MPTFHFYKNGNLVDQMQGADAHGLRCGAVCCSVLQFVAVCCSVFHLYKNGNLVDQMQGADAHGLRCVAVCCSVVQCAAVCCSVLQFVAA